MKFSSSHISYFLNDDMSVILLSTHILSQMRAIWQNVCVELLLFSFWWWMQNGYGGILVLGMLIHWILLAMVECCRALWQVWSVVASVNGIHMVLTCMVLLSIVGVIML